jgi:hypothetical protein
VKNGIFRLDSARPLTYHEISFYPDVFNDELRVMAGDDWKIDTRVRTVLGNWITDPVIADKVAQKIVLAARRHAYGDIMERIGYFQIEGISQVNCRELDVFWDIFKVIFTSTILQCFRYREIPCRNENPHVES